MTSIQNKFHAAILAICFVSLARSDDSRSGNPDSTRSNPTERWSEDGPGGVPSFSKHIVPLLNRAGCSARECHGAFQGQNGFRLSLFGYDLKLDHEELTHDPNKGPRVDLQDVEQSLILRKPLEEIDHEGGQRFASGSWQHRMLRAWIKDGAKFDPTTSAIVQRLEVYPSKICDTTKTTPIPLQVLVHFSDGTCEDLTSLALYSSNDASVATVDESGKVTIAGQGDTTIVITFAGSVTTIPILSPYSSPIDSLFYPSENRADELVADKLRKLNLQPSELCSDSEFIRRAYIDCIGCLPRPEEVRSFLSDQTSDKRERLVDHLLGRSEYALYWATLWSDWTGNNRGTLNPNYKTTWLWYDWLTDKLKKNVPYDQFVKGIITATSREGRSLETYQAEVASVWGRIEPRSERKNGFDDGTYGQRQTLDLYWLKRGGSPEELAIRTANTFLGLQIQCAQCHKHPFDRWTQDDFTSWQSFFMVTDIAATDGGERGDRLDYQSVALYCGAYRGGVSQLAKVPPRILGGAEVPFREGGEDPREVLWRWMVSPENPWFARSIVNRLWSHYFGIGIVDPVDDFNAANPPSNPELIDWLARDFIEHAFDLKHLHRRIMNSRTYQLSHLPNDSNRNDHRNFSHAIVRRVQAEVLTGAIDDVTGIPTRYGTTYTPLNTRAIGCAATTSGQADADYAFQIFGRPKRLETSIYERSTQASLVQALYLLNDNNLIQKIDDPNGRAARLASSDLSTHQIVEELYFLILSRPPTDAEMSVAMVDFDRDKTSRREAVEDLMWALFNVREFIFIK